MDRTQLWKQISGPFVIIKCHFAWLEQEIGMSLDVISKEDTNEIAAPDVYGSIKT